MILLFSVADKDSDGELGSLPSSQVPSFVNGSPSTTHESVHASGTVIFSVPVT